MNRFDDDITVLFDLVSPILELWGIERMIRVNRRFPCHWNVILSFLDVIPGENKSGHFLEHFSIVIESIFKLLIYNLKVIDLDFIKDLKILIQDKVNEFQS